MLRKTIFLMTVTTVQDVLLSFHPVFLWASPTAGMDVGKVVVKGCDGIMGVKIIGLFVQCLQIAEWVEGKGQILWHAITMLLSNTTRPVQICSGNVPKDHNRETDIIISKSWYYNKYSMCYTLTKPKMKTNKQKKSLKLKVINIKLSQW